MPEPPPEPAHIGESMATWLEPCVWLIIHMVSVIAWRFAASGVSDLWWVGVLIAVATFAAGTVVFERSKRRFAQEL